MKVMKTTKFTFRNCTKKYLGIKITKQRYKTAKLHLKPNCEVTRHRNKKEV